MAARTRAAIQDDAAVAPVQRPVSLLAQGRHGDHGPPGRADASAAADRHQGAAGLHREGARRYGHPRERAARLVNSEKISMSVFEPGLVHTPVTPFTRDNRIDYDTFGRLIEFHLRSGADSLALPTHIGESVSLTDEEQRALLAFAIRQVNGRKPIIAHASDAGSAIAADRARHAQELGAAAIVTTTPYYWTPPPHMIIEHFAAIGSAVSIPFFVYNSPEEMPGTKITAEPCLHLA